MRTNHDPADAAAASLALLERLADTLRTAEALVRSHRRVDLDGLDLQVHGLCARVLNLPPEQAAPLRARLRDLMVRIDSLLAALARAAPEAGLAQARQ